MIFEHSSKNKKYLFVITLLILLFGTLFLALPKTFDKNSDKSIKTEIETKNFGNDKIEGAITNYLVTQTQFSWKTKDNSKNFCSIENLDPEKELFPLYVWVYCGEYEIQNGNIKELSGSSGPAKINYPNELSFYDPKKFSYEVPGDGSNYSIGIKKIFPENLWERIYNFKTNNLIMKNQTTALEWFSSPQAGQNNLWEITKQAIISCNVKKIFQTHEKRVKTTLKNGTVLTAIEPTIDEVFNVIRGAAPNCGTVQMSTE